MARARRPHRDHHDQDEMSRQAARLRVALLINVVIVVAQIAAGVVASSLGLLSDAGHNLTDVAGLALAFVAVRFTRKPATAQRSFGWHRGTILAAQANAAMILALTVWISIEGVRRLANPPDVDGPIMIVVAAVAFVANSAAALVVGGHGGRAEQAHRDQGEHDSHGEHERRTPSRHRRDLNMQAAMLHLVSDAVASLGVVVAGTVIALRGGWNWLDPAVSLLIGASIGVHAWRLLRSSNAVLLEGTPEGLDPTEIRAAMLTISQVEAIHDLHVWSIASHFTALSAHVVVATGATLHEAQDVAGRVRTLLADEFGIEHSTLELEEERCAVAENGCDPTFGRAPTMVHPHDHH